MAKQITITRKIELRINSTNKEDINEAYSTLRKWRMISCKAANMVISAMYGNLKGEDIAYLTHKIAALERRPDDFELLSNAEMKALSKAEDKEIYPLIAAEKKGLFGTSEVNSYYQLLSKCYKGVVPTVILSCINNQVFADFNTDRKAYLDHDQSLRTYKKNMPIPFTSASFRAVHRISEVYKGNTYNNFAFTLFGLPLRTNFGRDLSGNHKLISEAFSDWFLPSNIWDNEANISEMIVDSREAGIDKEPQVHYLGPTTLAIEYVRIDNERHRYKITATGDEQHEFFMSPMKPVKKDKEDPGVIPGYKITPNYKFCDSKIILTEEQHTNDAGKKVERTKIFLLASLQFEERPRELDKQKVAYCDLDPEVPIKVTIGDKVFDIGTKDDFQFRRMGIQGAFKETQKALRYVKGGKGRKRKMQGLDRFSKYEKDVVKLKIHTYTKILMNLCLEYKCGVIYLRNQKQKEEAAKADEMVLRNWSYWETKSKILYKATRYNIDLLED